MDAAQMNVPRLKVVGLEKAYGSEVVLRGVSFDLAEGETLAIIGRSGAGKTTLLQCLNMIEAPDRGTVSLDGDVFFRDGEALFAPWEVRRQIALVFQRYQLFPNMTVAQNIMLGLRLVTGLDRREAHARAVVIARSLGIDAVLGRYPQEISGGQAQRCALARAIVLAPRVFLLDEITSALDPGTILDVMDSIRSIRDAPESEGMSVVLVTHLMHFAADFADRIAFLHEGTIHEEHAAGVFFQKAERQATRDFIRYTVAAFPGP